MHNRVIRIGTRSSELALFQAHTVSDQLQKLGFKTEIIPVKSTGDLVLDKPLYEMGITGIFTKTLDVAMVKNEVDIAVHSLKDVPTKLPNGIIQTAVLKRASVEDVLIPKDSFNEKEPCTIATGSLRRKAQWLHRYPHHNVVGLRGNVNTRLQSLSDSDWNGAIFAKAGLERIELLPKNAIKLSWMIPAAAQGAMVVVAREDDYFCQQATSLLNQGKAEICTTVEREFLRTLEGGCTAPIGALAKIVKEELQFTGVLFSLDGSQKLIIEKRIEANVFEGFGAKCAEAILANGGKELMESIKSELAS